MTHRIEYWNPTLRRWVRPPEPYVTATAAAREIRTVGLCGARVVRDPTAVDRADAAAAG